MKVRAVAFDEHERPAQVVVQVSIHELALALRLVGDLVPSEVQDGAGQDYVRALEELWTGGTSILNAYFDGGLNDLLPSGTLHRKEAK